MTTDLTGIEKAASGHRENQLQFVLTLVRRHWLLMLSCTVMGCALWGAFAWWFFKSPAAAATWQGQTQLAIKESPWEKDILKGAGGMPLFQNSPKALVERVSKRPVAEDVVHAIVQQEIQSGKAGAALATDEEYARRAESLLNKIIFEPRADVGLIIITARGDSEAEARMVTEFAARAFVDRNRQFQVEEEQETHAFLLRQLESTRQRLDEAQSKEWQYRKAMGFRTQEQVTRDMESMNKELLDGQTTREELIAKLGELESALHTANAQLPEALGQVNDSVVKNMMNELTKLLQEQVEMTVYAEPAYPPLQRLKDEIQEKKQAILLALGSLDGDMGAPGSTFQDRQNLLQQYQRHQLELASLDVRISTLEKLLSRMVEELPELSEKDKLYQDLKREAEQLDLQFNQLRESEFRLRTALGRASGGVERNSPTVVAVIQGRTIRWWIHFVIGAVVGLLVGSALSWIYEVMDTSVRSIEDVIDYLGLQVIGTIPEMRFTKEGEHRSRRRGTYVAVGPADEIDAAIVTQHDPKSPVSEAYRALRTNFQIATLQQNPKTVMITSAVPGEGKTTTAVNMAVTFADSGKRVLIIDTDLRRPYVHHVLRMDRGRGLADVLRDGLDPREVVRPTRIQNLSIISSGRLPTNPSELIGSGRMRNVMDQLSKEYDLIICDAPSIHVVTDPILLGRELDAVILVVAAEWAARETILRAKKHLETADAKIAGVVLNALEATRRHYYYYYYYYDEGATARRRRWYHFG